MEKGICEVWNVRYASVLLTVDREQKVPDGVSLPILVKFYLMAVPFFFFFFKMAAT